MLEAVEALVAQHCVEHRLQRAAYKRRATLPQSHEARLHSIACGGFVGYVFARKAVQTRIIAPEKRAECLLAALAEGLEYVIVG